MATIFEGLADLAAIGRGVEMEASAIELAVRNTIGTGAIVAESAEEGVQVTIGETRYPITTFVENLLSEESKMMEALKTTMPETGYTELSKALRTARGVTSLSREALSMLDGIRGPLEDLDYTAKALTNAESSESMFKALLEDSASTSSKNAELLQKYEKLATELSAATAAKTEVTISGSTFKYVLVAGAFITVYEMLGEVAEQNSGCYIFSKKNSTSSLIRQLSGQKSWASTAIQCTGCKLQAKTENSPEYQRFRNSGTYCDTNLCQLKSLEPPFNNSNDYSMSCIKLDRFDILADFTKKASDAIGPAVRNIATMIIKQIAPAAAVIGISYLGFKLGFNYLSGNLSGMRREAPDYYQQRKRLKTNESTL